MKRGGGSGEVKKIFYREKKFLPTPETINFAKKKSVLFFDKAGVVAHVEEAADGLGIA